MAQHFEFESGTDMKKHQTEIIREENRTLDRVLTCLLAVFVISQFFIDNYYLYTDPRLMIKSITIPTLYRYFFTALLAVLLLAKARFRRRLAYFMIYAAAAGVYLYFHLYFNRSFNSFLKVDPFSVKSEIFYVTRLCLPLFFFVIVRSIRQSRDFYFRLLRISAASVLLLLILSNLFCAALGSYRNKVISVSILGWFGEHQYEFDEMASRGWFYFANQISLLLLLLLLSLLPDLVCRRNKLTLLIFLFSAPAFLILGTRIAAASFLLMAALAFGCFIIEMIREKRVRRFSLLAMAFFALLSALYIYVLPQAPASIRFVDSGIIAENKAKEASRDPLHEEDRKTGEQTGLDSERMKEALGLWRKDRLDELSQGFSHKEKVHLVRRLKASSAVYEYFIDRAYPYTEDPDFWLQIMRLSPEQQMDYRFIEISMIQRLDEVNNSPMTRFFGLGMSRQQAVFNIERDFINQYYSLGLAGVLLLISPYAAGAFYIGIYILLNLKKRFNLYNLSVLAALFCCLAGAYLSGNILDSLFVMMFYTYLLGSWFRHKAEDEKEEEGSAPLEAGEIQGVRPFSGKVS